MKWRSAVVRAGVQLRVYGCTMTGHAPLLTMTDAIEVVSRSSIRVYLSNPEDRHSPKILIDKLSTPAENSAVVPPIRSENVEAYFTDCELDLFVEGECLKEGSQGLTSSDEHHLHHCCQVDLYPPWDDWAKTGTARGREL